MRAEMHHDQPTKHITIHFSGEHSGEDVVKPG